MVQVGCGPPPWECGELCLGSPSVVRARVASPPGLHPWDPRLGASIRIGCECTSHRASPLYRIAHSCPEGWGLDLWGCDALLVRFCLVDEMGLTAGTCQCVGASGRGGLTTYDLTGRGWGGTGGGDRSHIHSTGRARGLRLRAQAWPRVVKGDMDVAMDRMITHGIGEKSSSLLSAGAAGTISLCQRLRPPDGPWS